jgi:hypothetical protein
VLFWQNAQKYPIFTKNFVNSDEFFIFYAILPIKSTFSVLSLAIF